MSVNKVTTLEALVADVGAARSVAFGGGGVQRKPMAAVRAIAASTHDSLDVVSFLGGPDVDMLIGVGKVQRLSFAFVGFDAYGLAPNFRKAREAGELDIVEYSEATFLCGLEAAAKRLPFMPTRFGMGTDIVTTRTSPFKVFTCPLTGEELLAVPPIAPDIAVIHVNAADQAGNAVFHSDSYSDPLLVRAAKRVYLTAERIVDDLASVRTPRSTFISRLWTHGVISAPRGGGMTAVFPDYPVDVPGTLAYQKDATRREWLDQHIRSAA